MEFSLNKIDPQLREQVNLQTKEGKVHTKHGVSINKNKSDRKNQYNRRRKPNKEKFSLSKYANKNDKISIEAIKVEKITVDVTIEKRIDAEELCKGIFLDTRK